MARFPIPTSGDYLFEEVFPRACRAYDRRWRAVWGPTAIPAQPNRRLSCFTNQKLTRFELRNGHGTLAVFTYDQKTNRLRIRREPEGA